MARAVKKGDKSIKSGGAVWSPLHCPQHEEEGYTPSCDDCKATAANTVDHINRVKEAS